MAWGVYAGDDVNDTAAFQSLTNRSPDIVAVFVHWGNDKNFPMQYNETVRDKNKTLLIFWESINLSLRGGNDPRFSYSAILRGDWDKYINDFAHAAKTYKGSVIIVPFPEMNLNETNWSGVLNNNSAAEHIQAYRKLRQTFRKAGANNAKFGWAPDSASYPNITGNQIEDYYPGDDYVDYTGVDGFDFWNQSFGEIFNNSLAKLEIYDKPIYIFSTACQEKPGKTDWIRDLGRLDISHPKVAGFIWFNGNKERDWRVNSSAESLKAFREITA